MKTSRQIALEVMEYSKAHENDALEAGESYGDIKWAGWETPYYCQSIDELEIDIAQDGYTTTKQAIAGMTKGFQLRHAYSEDIRGAGDADSESKPAAGQSWTDFYGIDI